VPPTEPRTPLSPHRVDLVDEDDAGLIATGLFEEVPDAGRAHPHEHLHEIGAADAEEGHIRLPGDRPREKGFPRPRGPEQENTPGHPSPQLGEAPGILEVLHDLLKLLLRLVAARHVAEVDLGTVVEEELRLALREIHHLAAAALHVVEDEDPGSDQQQGREERGHQVRPPGRLLGRRDLHAHPLARQGGGQIAHAYGIGLELLPLLCHTLDRRLVDRHLRDLPRVHGLEEIAVGDRLLPGPVLPRRQKDVDDADDQHDQDQIEAQILRQFSQTVPFPPSRFGTRLRPSLVRFGCREDSSMRPRSPDRSRPRTRRGSRIPDNRSGPAPVCVPACPKGNRSEAP